MVHKCTIRTRYCESDSLGHINNVSYLIYLEQARVDFMLDNEIIPSIENWPFVLASIHCDYIKQVYVNQTLSISSFVVEIGQSSFKLANEIRDRQTDELLAFGEAVIVHFDFTKQKSSPIPDEMRRKLEVYKKISV